MRDCPIKPWPMSESWMYSDSISWFISVKYRAGHRKNGKIKKILSLQRRNKKIRCITWSMAWWKKERERWETRHNVQFVWPPYQNNTVIKTGIVRAQTITIGGAPNGNVLIREMPTEKEMSCYTEGCSYHREVMTDGQIEKDKVLGLKQSLACFVVCWLIAGPTGQAVPRLCRVWPVIQTLGWKK